MPRQPRLDAPETLHHVMVRGRERRFIFKDDTDRDDFVTRVATLADAGGWTVYAWALLPNHAHLLVRTGIRPLPRKRKGTGQYAVDTRELAGGSPAPGAGFVVSSAERQRARVA